MPWAKRLLGFQPAPFATDHMPHALVGLSARSLCNRPHAPCACWAFSPHPLQQTTCPMRLLGFQPAPFATDHMPMRLMGCSPLPLRRSTCPMRLMDFQPAPFATVNMPHALVGVAARSFCDRPPVCMTTNAMARPEGAKALSPGHRPGLVNRRKCALKGQKRKMTSVVKRHFKTDRTLR